MDAGVYLQLIALPEAQRPPEAAGLTPWVEQWVAEDVTRLEVFSSALPDSNEGRAVVDDVRARAARPMAATRCSPAVSRRARTTSWPASPQSVPWAIAIVVGVTGIVLFLTFGSVFLPIKAVLMSLLSHHRQLRRAGLDLPGGKPVRAARLRPVRDHWSRPRRS